MSRSGGLGLTSRQAATHRSLFVRARLLTCILALLALTPGAVATIVDVRLLDYNIHRAIGGSDSNVGSQPELAKVINYLNPDVWTINELGGNSSSFSVATAQNLLSSFIRTSLTIFGANPVEGVNFFVYVGTISDGFIGNAIVSRYPLLETQSYSDAGGGFGALRCLQLALVVVPGPTDIGVFTTHLKAQDGNNDALRRQAEANADKATISTWMTGHASAAVVLTGDLNESEDPEDATNWKSHKIGDPLPGTNEPYRPISTLASVGLQDAKPLSIRGDNDTISSTNPNARFDYILYSGDKLTLKSSLIFDTAQYTGGELAALNAANGTNFIFADSAGASDHLPVFAVLTVPEPNGFVVFVCGIAWVAGCARLVQRRNPRRMSS
jgi:endonuclease/exonuclease/phosphatase family metal-dependent hydrolase